MPEWLEDLLAVGSFGVLCVVMILCMGVMG